MHVILHSLRSSLDQGTSDEVVDYSHGKKLWELSKEKYEPLWLKGGGHSNLELYPEYIKHLKKYVATVNKRKTAKSSANGDNDEIKQTKTKTTDRLPEPFDRLDISRKSIDSIGNTKKLEEPEKSRMSTDQADKYKRKKGWFW